jgi:hypothetical protein
MMPTREVFDRVRGDLDVSRVRAGCAGADP